MIFRIIAHHFGIMPNYDFCGSNGPQPNNPSSGTLRPGYAFVFAMAVVISIFFSISKSSIATRLRPSFGSFIWSE